MKAFQLLSIAIIATILSGCATNIAKLPITARDRETYENKYAKEYLKENKQVLKVAIVPNDPRLQGRTPNRSLTTLRSLSTAFGDGLETAFSSLSDFEVVPRSELNAILADKQLANMTSGQTINYRIKNVNYLVVYRVSSFNFEKFKPLFADKKQKPRFRAYVKVKVSLINLGANVKEFTKTITGKSGGSAPSADIGLLNRAIENAVKDFSTQFAVEYAPPAIVQQTKGEGQVALLNIGKDCGLAKDMKIEFFTFKEKNGRRRAIPFAYGEVIEAGEDFAWVEVDDYEDAGVKENHFARVRKDQSRSPWD